MVAEDASKGLKRPDSRWASFSEPHSVLNLTYSLPT